MPQAKRGLTPNPHTASRRKFLRQLAMLAPAAALAPGMLATTGCKVELGNEDTGIQSSSDAVIVIGAGIAGLAAARQARQRGYTPIVFEGSNRLGGRILTDRTSITGAVLEQGAQWIHNAGGTQPLSQLFTLANITGTFNTDFTNLSLYDAAGVAVSGGTQTTYQANYAQLLSTTVPGAATATRSVRDALQVANPSVLTDALMRYYLTTGAERDLGGSIESLASQHINSIARYPGTTETLPTGGWDALITYLAQGLDIRLNQRVTKIDTSRLNQAEVTTADGKLHYARFVIITVPLGVLKQDASSTNHITFNPELPTGKRDAIARARMGNTNRIFLKYGSQFWPATHCIGYASALTEAKGKFPLFINHNMFAPGTNVLSTFALGQYGAAIEARTNDQVAADVTAYLRSLYGTGVPSPTTTVVTRWGQNPWSFGSSPYYNTGLAPQDIDIIRDGSGTRLRFAGDHCRKDYLGTAHGAYLSGVDAALGLPIL